jgi:hypothetical protein
MNMQYFWRSNRLMQFPNLMHMRTPLGASSQLYQTQLTRKQSIIIKLQQELKWL